ncbi:MAG: cytochrome C oxidase subunit IV family protein [Acidobacteriia bacterium]|nr:cytochrome C oxidase subunit IV family protein [Terriglobia bacterium]
MSEHSEQSGHVGHVVPVSTYIIVFILLMMGTALTTGVAYIDLGRWNTVVALTIAVTKMMLVVLFFMHAKYATGLTRVVILAGFFWLGIMITLSCSDELTRTWEIVPQGWNMIVPFVSRLF